MENKAGDTRAFPKGSYGSLFCWLLWLLAGQVAASEDCGLKPEQLKSLHKVEIRQVYDGDTVLLADNRKVRFIGINTPETPKPDRPGEPLAEKAKAYLLPWQGKTVYLQTGSEQKDRYGRTLGHLFTQTGRNLTASLLREGLGFLVAIPPNVAYTDCYRKQSAYARQENLGVWAHPYFRLRTSSLVSDLKGGFGRFKGKIERVYVGKKVIWIDLFGDITLRVAKKDLAHLKGEVLERLLTAVDNDAVLKLPHIEFSGWLIDRSKWGAKMTSKIRSGKRKRWQMNIRHRHHWRLSTS